ncbi:MAG: P1 family peptidase, partial [Solobacterium sp.]|nr:P1 family peptidase [Solobacterium sp.]
YKDGNYGAGIGATVGKMQGMANAIKTGIGSYAVEVNGLKVGAVVVLNALGDVYDGDTIIAGLMNPEHTAFVSSEAMLAKVTKETDRFTGNTTIAAVITNAAFDKTKLCKIAAMAHNGLARRIRPVNTSADGDSIYALSCGDLPADPDMVGTLAAEVLSRAIVRAVTSAESAYGYPCAAEISQK